MALPSWRTAPRSDNIGMYIEGSPIMDISIYHYPWVQSSSGNGKVDISEWQHPGKDYHYLLRGY